MNTETRQEELDRLAAENVAALDGWDIDELDSLAADGAAARERLAARIPIAAARHTGMYNSTAPAPIPRAVPMRLSQAGTVPAIGWLREIRLAAAGGVITKREAREWLNLPRRPWWRFGR